MTKSEFLKSHIIYWDYKPLPNGRSIRVNFRVLSLPNKKNASIKHFITINCDWMDLPENYIDGAKRLYLDLVVKKYKITDFNPFNSKKISDWFVD